MTDAAEFREHHVEADGFRIRYMEAGEGPTLVHLHGAGGLRLTPAHDLLAHQFRVIALEIARLWPVAGKHAHAEHAGAGRDDV